MSNIGYIGSTDLVFAAMFGVREHTYSSHVDAFRQHRATVVKVDSFRAASDALYSIVDEINADYRLRHGIIAR